MRDVQPCEVSPPSPPLPPAVYIGVSGSRLTTHHNRRCLGIEAKKGTLRPGADADLVVLDRKGKVLGIWGHKHEV